jgi:hypothetical protein
MGKYPDKKVTLEGHTDSTGSAELNKKLSQQRADFIRGVLISKGVAADRITAIGYGQSQLLCTFRKADNYTEINVLRKSKNNLDLGDINSLQKEHLQVCFSRCHATLGCTEIKSIKDIYGTYFSIDVHAGFARSAEARTLFKGYIAGGGAGVGGGHTRQR